MSLLAEESPSKEPRKPVVFLSSVFSGLLGHRETLHRIVTDDFGWECLAYEFETERFGGSPRSACLQAVDACDLYIGVFWKRSGSLVPHDNLNFTEMEYYRARKNRKPMRIYVVEASPNCVDMSLKIFLETVKEPDNGVCIEFCKNFNQLQSSVTRDLDYFSECWAEEKTVPWQPSLLTDRILENLGFLLGHSKLFHLPTHGSFTSNAFTDHQYLEDNVNAMQYHYSQSEFLRCGEIGSLLLVAFLNQRAVLHTKPILQLWIRFLQMWSGTCTWLNILNVPYGAVWTARVLAEAYEAQEDWPSYFENASRLSNVYYVEACSIDDEKRNIAQIRNKTFREEQRDVVGLQNALEGERQDRLKRALNYYNLFIERFKPSHLNLYRAYIYQVRGQYDQAIRDFTCMVDDRMYGPNELSYLDAVADLGTTKILKAKRDKLSQIIRQRLISEGIALLNNAHERVQQYSSYPTLPTYLIIEKEYAKGLLNTGQMKAAEELLGSLHRLARREGLSQQAESIRLLLTKSRLAA